jgi:cell division protein FtsB
MNMTRILFWILGLLVLLLFLRLWVGPGSYPDIWRLEQQKAEYNDLNDLQGERNRRLKQDVDSLSQNDTAVEEHARSELGMIKEGETFYQVILKSDSQPLANLPPPAPEKQHVE